MCDLAPYINGCVADQHCHETWLPIYVIPLSRRSLNDVMP